MSFRVIGKTIDLKSGAHVIYCQASPDEYLDIVGESFGDFSIQRKRENHKAYKRLKSDIIEGCLLPSITLSVKHHLVRKITEEIENIENLQSLLSKKDVVDILDGLQRTYLLSDIRKEGLQFREGQELLLEFWLEPEISKLIYRMIVLNSGQKAMSMRHQVELLFHSLRQTIVERVPGIDILLEKEVKRRTQPNKYSLSNIASSYQAFITSSHENDKENLVAQRLIDEDAFDSTEQELTEQFETYIKYLKVFYQLDQLCWNRYATNRYEIPEGADEEEIKNINMKKESLEDAFAWLGSENVMLSFFGALSQYLKANKEERIEKALQVLMNDVRNPEVEDPLGLLSFNKVKSGLNVRKTNVGFATRKLIATGFKDFFREEGDIALEKCWPAAAE
jgi:hypothetical protein